MRIATTTGDFDRYCPEMNDRIRHVAEAGFKCVDLSLYGEAKPDAITLSENWREAVDSWQKTASDLGVKFVQCHSAGGNPLNRDANFDLLLQATIRSIEICGILGIPNTVVHSGWADSISKNELCTNLGCLSCVRSLQTVTREGLAERR